MADARFDGVREAAEQHLGDDSVPGLVALVAHGGETRGGGDGPPLGGRSAGRARLPLPHRLDDQAGHRGRHDGARRRRAARPGRAGRQAAPRARRPSGAAPDGRSAGRHRGGRAADHHSRSADVHLWIRDGHGDVHGQAAVAGRRGGGRARTGHDRAARSRCPARPGPLDRRPRLAAAARPARAALALQHRRLGARSPAFPGRRRVVPGGRPAPLDGAPGNGRHQLLDRPSAATGDGLPADAGRSRRLGRAGRQVESPARLRGRRRRTGIDRR